MADAFPIFPIFAFLASALVIVPLPWHFQAWNAGTCLFMIWTSLACLNFGINSMVWHENAINHAPIWCDVSTRIIVAGSVGIPIASLCISRRLHKIATSSIAIISRSEKRRVVIVDLCLGIGIPLLQIAMQYIVSGHRFDIYEDLGCFPATYNTPVAYPLSLAWPLAIGLVSAVYNVLTLIAFCKRRIQFNQLLSASKSLNANYYFRLMALAFTNTLCTMSITLYGMILNLTESPIYPWISWEDTHFNWGRIGQYPALLWSLNRQGVIALQMSRWLPIFCAVVFFAFFGFAEEARRRYSSTFQPVLLFLRTHPPTRQQQPRPFAPLAEKPPVFPPASPSSSENHSLVSTPAPSFDAAVASPHIKTQDSAPLREDWSSTSPSTDRLFLPRSINELDV